MRSFIALITAGGLMLGSATSGQAQDLGALLGGSIGAAIGAAAGGRNGAAGAAVGGIIGVAMGTILQQLNQAEMQSRQVAFQQAAKGRSARWSSGKKGARATYVNKGKVAGAGGKSCSKVQETITLPDGKRATSMETVCFS